jgi:2-polyprenyl-3-methyl-5-hydroxy-6-metoxy-1,4-benzoquinol methylase
MNERTYHGGTDRLRQKERTELMEIDRVVLLSLAGISARSVLDVGTGTGLFAEAFAQKGLRVACGDIIPTSQNLALIPLENC